MNLGKIIGVANSQHVILKAYDWPNTKKIPIIGDLVYNAEKKKIGILADIFGPVTFPYISVKLNNNSEENINSFKDKRKESLYTIPAKKKGLRGPKGGRNKKKYNPKGVPKYRQSSKPTRR
ncbi:MAG: H/ACA ribonucleoprotein complex subunit GAR1 [Promethearchaeota archaeon]